MLVNPIIVNSSRTSLKITVTKSLSMTVLWDIKMGFKQINKTYPESGGYLYSICGL